MKSLDITNGLRHMVPKPYFLNKVFKFSGAFGLAAITVDRSDERISRLFSYNVRHYITLFLPTTDARMMLWEKHV